MMSNINVCPKCNREILNVEKVDCRINHKDDTAVCDMDTCTKVIKEYQKRTEKAELTIEGIMLSVEKWIDPEDEEKIKKIGDPNDPMVRAVFMRRKTLNIVESLQARIKELKEKKQKDVPFAFGGELLEEQAKKDFRDAHRKGKSKRKTARRTGKNKRGRKSSRG